MTIKPIITIALTFVLTVFSIVPCEGKKNPLHHIPASDSRIAFVGRILSEGGNVSFDWSGVSFSVNFTGTYIAVRCSDTKANYFNVWIDRKPDEKEDFVIRTAGKDTVIVLAENLDRGRHCAVLQKRTEGEQGTVTVHEIITDGELLPAYPHKDRYIEFVGDSYTCGFGTESALRTDPFRPETENCNLTYAAIISRYFDADFSLVSHSGQGVARNYDSIGDGYTMVERYGQLFDEDRKAAFGPEHLTRIPDVVVIYLGANDFSCGMQPAKEIFVQRYNELISKVKANYGDGVPVVCLASKVSPELYEYVLAASVACRYDNVFFSGTRNSVHNDDSDLGACWHPNYSGHRKVASVFIPYIATVTGWNMPFEPYR